MGFKHLLNPFKRFHAVILLCSFFGFTTTTKCEDYGMRNIMSWMGNDRDWEFNNFTDSQQCLMCFNYTNGGSHPSLFLPCKDGPSMQEVVISYLFRSGPNNTDNPGFQPPQQSINSLEISVTPFPTWPNRDPDCNILYNMTSPLRNVSIKSFTRIVNSSRETPMIILPTKQPYCLRISSNLPSGSIVCITNVTFIRKTTPGLPPTSKPSHTTRVTTRTTVETTTTGLSPTPNSSPHTARVSTRTTVQAQIVDDTTIAELTTLSSDANSTNQLTKSWGWLIILFVVFVIFAVSAVAVIFLRVRKKHQQENNRNTGKVAFQSNNMNKDTERDDGVVYNPTYGKGTTNDKDEEYHSYAEPNINESSNCDMIYNSAYESSSSKDEKYHAYAEPDINESSNCDMTYNSAYESFSST